MKTPLAISVKLGRNIVSQMKPYLCLTRRIKRFTIHDCVVERAGYHIIYLPGQLIATDMPFPRETRDRACSWADGMGFECSVSTVQAAGKTLAVVSVCPIAS